MYDHIKPIQLQPVVDEVKSIDINEINKFKIDINEEIPLPEIILSICDPNGDNKRMVMTRQNISCVTAQAKVGKTFLIKLIISACLKKSVFQNRLHSEMPKHRDRILYIDTEQSKFHVQLGLKQMRDIVNKNSTDENNNFNSVKDKIDVFQFDTLDYETGYAYTETLIYSKLYSLVIIDGVADIIEDSNDLKVSKKFVSNLRKWATECDLHILNVIHLNPGDLSHKMKGHLGTILADKSETVLGVSIDKNNASVRLVQSLATRNRKPDPFAFEILENGNPSITDYEFEEVSSLRKKREPIRTKKDKLNDFSFDIINECFLTSEEKGLMYHDICDRIKRGFFKFGNESLGDRYAKDFLKDCIETGKVLYEPAQKKYYIGELNIF